MEDESVHRAPSPPTAKHRRLHPAGCQIRPPQGHGTQIRPPSVVSFISVLWPPPPVTGRHICQPLGVVSSIPGNRLPLPTTASSELLGITVPFFLASGRRGHQGFFKCFIWFDFRYCKCKLERWMTDYKRNSFVIVFLGEVDDWLLFFFCFHGSNRFQLGTIFVFSRIFVPVTGCTLFLKFFWLGYTQHWRAITRELFEIRVTCDGLVTTDENPSKVPWTYQWPLVCDQAQIR